MVKAATLWKEARLNNENKSGALKGIIAQVEEEFNLMSGSINHK